MKWYRKALKLKGDELDEAIENLEVTLKATAEKLNEALDVAHEAVEIAESIGGEVDRVVAGQLEAYLIGNVSNFADDSSQTGSVPSLLEFLEDEEQWEEEEEKSEEKETDVPY